MNQNLEIYYDIEDDRLEIQIGERTQTYFDEIEDDVYEGHDEKTEELKGYIIFNFIISGKKGRSRFINITSINLQFV
jgi:hypothetical protein